jgi:hypothetical protein
MSLIQSITKGSIALALVVGFGSPLAYAQRDIETIEARAALSAALGQNRSLQAQVAKLTQVNKNLAASLMAANTESEEFRRSYSEMRKQMEALGIDAITGGDKGIEARLVKAVNDIRLLEEEKTAISEALIALSDASLRFVETSVNENPVAVAAVEKALVDGDRALGLGSARAAQSAGATSLHDGRIVSVKKDYGVIVLNVGRQTGVRIGMPFDIRRKDRPVGTAIIVDVRDNIAAALVKNLNSTDDAPQVGDLATVATTD